MKNKRTRIRGSCVTLTGQTADSYNSWRFSGTVSAKDFRGHVFHLLETITNIIVDQTIVFNIFLCVK
jgi:hypothetical protein